MKVVPFLYLVASDDESSGDEDFEESDDEGSDFEVAHKSPSRKKSSVRPAKKVKITPPVEGIDIFHTFCEHILRWVIIIQNNN